MSSTQSWFQRYQIEFRLGVVALLFSYLSALETLYHFDYRENENAAVIVALLNHALILGIIGCCQFINAFFHLAFSSAPDRFLFRWQINYVLILFLLFCMQGVLLSFNPVVIHIPKYIVRLLFVADLILLNCFSWQYQFLIRRYHRRQLHFVQQKTPAV